MNNLKNLHSNFKRIIQEADENWNTSQDSRLSGLNVKILEPNYLEDQHGRRLHHFCTTSYLGLDYHQSLISGAIRAIERTGILRVANSKNRCKLALLDDYEAQLSDLFERHCLATLSCSAASAGILPLLAAGIFTGNKAPTMVFDRHAHYSMNHTKAACADETEVCTIPHNDLNQLEDLCRRKQRLAYVADGYYSMGGASDMEGLIYLQERYGLFLYLDDSHALSAVGRNGWGHCRSAQQDFSDNTIIVASLGKAFGAGGGLAMLGSSRQKELMHRYGGPSNWSQSLNVAAIGAGMASISLHKNHELSQLQIKLQCNLKLFDSLVYSDQSKSRSPIRMIRVASPAEANRVSKFLANKGFLTSAVFFPIVPKDQSAIRITLRADMEPALIEQFCMLLSDCIRLSSDA